MLHLLSENLRMCDFVTKSTPILQATVPVIKINADPNIVFEDFPASEQSFSLMFDIIVDSSNYMDFLST